MPINTKALPGFHDSDNTYPEIVIYQHGTDPVMLSSEIKVALAGKVPTDKSASVTSVTTHKDIGAASGSFTIQVKPSQVAADLFKTLVDDSWVDIILYKNDSGYHVMRGLIDEVRRNRRVSGSGTTIESYTIVGRDFGKIWEQTPIWFSPYANDFLTQAASTIIFSGNPKLWKSPGETPIILLRDFMEAVTNASGVNWVPPKSMPGIIPTSFTGNVNFGDDILTGMSLYYQNIPATTQFNPSGLMPDGMLWDLAKEYSDPMFTELYVDILPIEGPYSPRIALGDALNPLENRMSVVLRNKPFPFLPKSPFPGFLPTWYKLPIHILARQEIVTDDVGRAGYERYNAIFAANRILSEALAGDALYAMGPLLDKDSMKRHGLRRLDIQSCVVPDLISGLTADTVLKHQKNLMRDWYCMNPYLLSGTFQLGHGRPDIKIGNKLHIPGRKTMNPLNSEPDERYYVEVVDHSWTAGPGLRTNIGVTRGWIGSDGEYLTALAKCAKKYEQSAISISLKGE